MNVIWGCFVCSTKAPKRKEVYFAQAYMRLATEGNMDATESKIKFFWILESQSRAKCRKVRNRNNYKWKITVEIFLHISLEEGVVLN